MIVGVVSYTVISYTEAMSPTLPEVRVVYLVTMVTTVRFHDNLL